MGKNIISQRRGRGTTTYRAQSHTYVAEAKHRMYDDIEKSSAVKGKIMDIVHCPAHSAPLLVIKYENGEQSYIPAPENVRVNDIVSSGFTSEVKIGNTLPLQNIPEGTLIYNIEILPGDRGKICRSSGTFARVITKTRTGIIVELPSKKQKLFNPNCRATVGIISGGGRVEKPWVKAGNKHHAMRARGKLYPRTSGVAMNAVDHPFGSGRGRKKTKKKPCGPHAPPGRKVGAVSARRTGRKK